ncbi:YkgJ family cysteine cluster protein [Nodosilinea nodulosa]|uniref:YkgJ family cysteine cluster protein n=1 Tax=Nodosilinea nodulosa TaxID=416001 RepID=UPI0003077304|nr:YkgJ family cysteine cluster protein [Nodosilinea nodulosa]
MATWQCVKSCGACCFLAPAERPDLASYLTPDQLALYLSMVGEDGWCIHYSAGDRLCRIYPDRPDFCRVTFSTFESMFGIASDELDDFAIDCCQEHIGDIYGDPSPEMERFNRAVGVGE